MTFSVASLLAFAQAAMPVAREAPQHPHIDYVPVLEAPPEPVPAAPLIRAIAPLDPVRDTTLGEDGLRIGKVDLFEGGKLLLTNGTSTVEGASGGGLARWATIGGRQMPGGIGASAHATAIELSDFGWRSYGVALGFGDRVELSVARADLDTREIGALLGIGQGYTLNMETFGAKVRVVGDLVYGESWLPQIAVGIEHKRSRDSALILALGAANDAGTDYTVSATKLLLARSLLLSATLRYTEANELGLLGFGSAASAGYKLQFEGSLGYQLSRRAVVGAEYRTKSDNLGLGEDDWMDIFAAYALTDYLTLTAAYVDLGSIATIPDQRGGFLSAQVAF
jgi:hypothetical protein